MKDIGLGAEELAALLDGKLDQSRRAELLARLGSSEEALEAYANASAVVNELEAGDTTRSTAPSKLTGRAPRRVPRWSWMAIAAALAGIAVAPWLWNSVIKVLLDQPVFAVLGVVGILLMILFRPSKPLIGYSRD